MLKGLRWPLLALLLSGVLLVVAALTRPDDSPSPKSAPVAAIPSPTPQPELLSTPVPEAAPQPRTPVVAVAALPAAPENILVEALVGQIHKLNPLLAVDNPVDRDITSLIFEGLTATNEYGEIIPDLADSWTISPDALDYIMVLRDDVLWQDGLPFTADDVVFTFGLLSDPLFPGAESLREFWRTVEIDRLSDHMVRFRLTQPLASFLDQLRIGIVPAHVLAGAPVDTLWKHPFNLSPIGTGPYQIETLTASSGQVDGIQLRVAPVYRQRPEGAEGYLLDRIVFRTYPSADAALDAYRQGEVNSIGSIPTGLLSAAQQIPGLSFYTAVQPHVGVLIYNWEDDTLRYVRNPRVRLALAHALDRASLVSQALAGRAIPADSPLLPDSWAYEAGLNWPAFDPAQAQSYLALANLTFDQPAPTPEPTATLEATPEGEVAPTPEATPAGEATPTEAPAEPAAQRSNFAILVLDDPALVTLAEGIAAGWQPLGFRVTVEPVGADSLQARLETGDFDVALVEFSFEPNADPDPYVFWHQGQHVSGQNYGGMDDRRISEALEMARRDPAGINRVTHYHHFQELFAERVPAQVLYYPLYTYAADVRLQGIQLGFLGSPSDRFRTIQQWHFGS